LQQIEDHFEDRAAAANQVLNFQVNLLQHFGSQDLCFPTW
jgi:hypothetical protein